MCKVSRFLKELCMKHFNKLSLIISIVLISLSKKISTKLILILFILIIININLLKSKSSNCEKDGDGEKKGEDEINCDYEKKEDEDEHEKKDKHEKKDEDKDAVNNNKNVKEDKKNNHYKKDEHGKKDEYEKKDECKISDYNKIFNEEIKLIYNKIIDDHKVNEQYESGKLSIKNSYDHENESNLFKLTVNSNTCSIPMFNLRTFDNIDYYYNFIIHNFDCHKINNLIMCKDIHKWMLESSLSNEDLLDDIIPIYFIKKYNNKINVYEYLKIFVHTDDDYKNALVQKGNDYHIIEKDINNLVEKELIKDLLNSKKYINYNLSSHDGVCNFLDKFLSLVLISENYIGKEVYLDIEYYVENKQSFDFFYNTINADLNIFCSTI